MLGLTEREENRQATLSRRTEYSRACESLSKAPVSNIDLAADCSSTALTRSATCTCCRNEEHFKCTSNSCALSDRADSDERTPRPVSRIFLSGFGRVSPKHHVRMCRRTRPAPQSASDAAPSNSAVNKSSRLAASQFTTVEVTELAISAIVALERISQRPPHAWIL